MKKVFGIFALSMALMLGACGAETEENVEAVTGTQVETEVTEDVSTVEASVEEVVEEEKEEEITWDVKASNSSYDINNMDYQLVWSDEFDVDGWPDQDKWGYDIGGSGWGNNELQMYTKKNAWVEDGNLIIALGKIKGVYTSARLVTKGKGDWLYGKFEIRAKLPSGVGTWPAIWMLPTKLTYGTWPASGEIDIMEHVGYDQDVINGTIHTGSYNHQAGTQKGSQKRVQGVSDDFHVYGLEWLPDKIIITVDDEEYFTFNPNDYSKYPSSNEWPFDQKMHLLLNVAYGGNWGGAMGVDDTCLPTKMEVDYVRVYQSPQVSDLSVEKEVENPLLKTDGKVIRNEAGTGDIVQLKGTNVGGYLLQEFWMTQTSNSAKVNAQLDVLNILAERFGEDEAMRLVSLYEENYFTEEDFDFCKEIGINTIRLPMWYRNFISEEGVLREDAFDRVDWFVSEAAKRNIYVILDMHGAPGSQNGSDHSGKDGGANKELASNFFFGKQATNNQKMYYELWEKIAEHYKDNPYVAAYDLLNEPFCTYRYNSHFSDASLHEHLWDIYDEAYRRIRAIDPDHIIMMEATWDPVDLPNPEDFGWENVVYEYHNYLYDDYDNKAGQQIANMKKKLDAITSANMNVPSYMGEFAYFNSLDAWDEGIALLNDYGINWTTWTYKVVSENGNWGIRHQSNAYLNLETASMEDIEAAWSKAGESKPNEKLVEILSKYYKLPANGEK